MREKATFKRKPPHRSTYKTQNRFNQKKHVPLDKTRDEQSNSFIFIPQGRDFNKLSPAQTLLFLFAMSTMISTVAAMPQNQPKVNENTQTGLITQNQNSFFAPQQSNTNSVVSLTSSMNTTQSLPAWPLRQVDMSSHLQIYPMTGQVHDCQQKLNGVSAGKICVIKDKKYLLKACGNEEGRRDRYSNIRLGMHNLYFIKENIGINTPNIKLIYEKNGQYIASDGEVVSAENYLASEFVENFNSFKGLSRDCTRMVIKSNHLKKATTTDLEIQNVIREKIAGQIGEAGVAKLAVAGTFIQDLVMNEGNWGIAGNELVIVDADHSPQSVEEYLTEAVKMPGNINLDFSIQTLEHMTSIYKEMLHKRPIRFHSEVDFNMKDYQFLIGQYLMACNQALEQIKAANSDLPLNKPSKSINQALSNALRTRLSEYIQAAEPMGLISPSQL